jgi:hypothetical protein
MINKIANITLYNLIFPLFTIILFIRLYKFQQIKNNKLILYNRITREWIKYHEK